MNISINKKVDHKSIWVDSMIGMTWGFIASLVVGTIVGLFAIHQHSSFSDALNNIKKVMTFVTGFAIGTGIGIKAKLKPLQILALGIGAWIVSESTLIPLYISGSIHWNAAKVGINTNFTPGDVFAAWLAGVAFVYLFTILKWETMLDIILLPFLGAVLGFACSLWLTYLTTTILVLLEWLIDHSANKAHWAAILLAPVIGAIMGLALSLPTSSAAIAFALKLHGDAATAAIAGTAAQMIAFGVLTFMATRKIGPSLAVGFGTSMLHLKNFTRKPLILLLPTIISAVVAIVGVAALPLDFAKTPSATSGMGSCALYGQIFTLDDNGWSNWHAWLNVALIQLLLPAILALGAGYLFFKKEWIKKQEMQI